MFRVGTSDSGLLVHFLGTNALPSAGILLSPLHSALYRIVPTVRPDCPEEWSAK
jgi:hypothetical protein